MIVLGIESSCDETAAAVVEAGRRVRSNVIASQVKLHEEYGGVVPEIASRAHAERILPVVQRAVREAGIELRDIDAIAVGHRPGLIGALLVGVSAAKALAWSLGVPIVGVDHIEAHLYAGLLDDEAWRAGDVFPALGLVVSGGHTTIFRCESATEVRKLGGTIDDAIGEAYDKAAAILGLSYPGGPVVDKRAQRGDERAHDFPISRLKPGSLDFSFSGLKTAVLYAVKGVPSGAGWDAKAPVELSEEAIDDVCASFQRAAVGAVTLKMGRALEQWAGEGPKAMMLGGGVSANSRLRAEMLRLGEERGVPVRIPKMAYCLDNAAMIAGLAYERLSRGEADGFDLRAAPTGASA
ncbi:MAG: tRNA (adenosine(37)-N6)-threonylcarbamoyltransferase complex transferase subunit TsaD [Phycisphaerales bacterium]|nr:tRNA (adenosine(37)-N6)-threonylcarbamoyltransferase complex transferase subunit TsaD [Phycisphaerales bacterium]